MLEHFQGDTEREMKKKRRWVGQQTLRSYIRLFVLFGISRQAFHMEHPHTRIPRATERSKMTVLLLLFELGEGNLRGAVNRHEKIEFSFVGSDFGDVDVKESDRIKLKRLLVRLVAFHLRQPADRVALQTPMQ